MHVNQVVSRYLRHKTVDLSILEIQGWNPIIFSPLKSNLDEINSSKSTSDGISTELVAGLQALKWSAQGPWTFIRLVSIVILHKRPLWIDPYLIVFIHSPSCNGTSLGDPPLLLPYLIKFHLLATQFSNFKLIDLSNLLSLITIESMIPPVRIFTQYISLQATDWFKSSYWMSEHSVIFYPLPLQTN